MRLIDADHFKQMIAGGAIKAGTETAAGLGAAICRLVDEEPTAYDVDKVIEQLECKTFTAELYSKEFNGQTINNLLCFGDIHEIIRTGGAE